MPASNTAFPDPIPGVIPFGSMCLLAGPAKSGKTALFSGMAVRWRDGKTIFGLPTNQPTAIGILTTDHKWHLNQGLWFARAGWPDIPHVSLRDIKTNWRGLRSSAQSDSVLNWALDGLNLPPGGLVCIDPIGAFITNRLNDYNEVLAGLGTISQFLDERQLSTLSTLHMSKQRGDPKDQLKDPYERVLGSGAQIGFSDTMFYLLRPKDIGDIYWRVGWQPTGSPEGTFDFTRDPATGLFVPFVQSPTVAPGRALTLLERVVEGMPDSPPGARHKDLMKLIGAACEVKEVRANQILHILITDGKVYKAVDKTYCKAKVN